MRIGYQKSADPRQFAAVILAAGLSSRMKDFKPLLPVDGRSAIAGLTESVKGAGVEDILAVTGYSRDRLQEELSALRIAECVNERYEDGMFSSIRKGLGEAIERWPDKKGYLLMPVDCPLISIETMKALMEASAEADEEYFFYVPTYEGKKGHPLLIPPAFAKEIASYEGEGGLKAVTDKYPDRMVRVPVTDEGCVLDMDTPEGYEEVCDFVRHGFRREKLSVLSARKTIWLVRHGQTRQHEEPMFIGQYDVPLDETGAGQANALGAQIADAIEGDVNASLNYVEGISFGREPLPPIENIYCSDLDRARETADRIAAAITSRYGASGFRPKVIPMEDLREVSLGEWDGRPIREIKELFPDDYVRRGEAIFTFKKGNHGENFFDMQYRAMKALRKILEDDFGKNIVIVAHSGVIRALENNLKGLRVDDDWEPLEKGCVRIWESPPTP